MRVRDDRHLDAGHPADLRRVHPAGVHDHVGPDRPLVGDDAPAAAALDDHVEHARALLDLGAEQARPVGQGERELAGIEVAVLRQERGGDDAVGRHRREELLRLGRRDDLDRQAEALRPAGLALDLLVALLRRREPQAAELVPAGILAGLAGQVGVEADRVLHHLRQADGRAQLADEPGRVPRRAVREAVLLDEHDVLPPQLGEVVEDRAPADAAADHHRPGVVPHANNPRTAGIDQSRDGHDRLGPGVEEPLGRHRGAHADAPHPRGDGRHDAEVGVLERQRVRQPRTPSRSSAIR